MRSATALGLGCLMLGCNNGRTVTRTVTGTVLFQSSQPAGGYQVSITGSDGTTSSTTTDSSGRFSAPGVLTPYTAAVVGQVSPPNAFLGAAVYIGLTGSTPVLVFMVTDNPASLPNYGTLAVTFDGGVFPQPDNYLLSLSFYVSADEQQLYYLPLPTTNPIVGATNDLTFAWAGTDTAVSGLLTGLQAQLDSQGRGVSYAYGTASATLANGGTTNVTLPLNAVTTTALITGSVVPPAGFTSVVMGNLAGAETGGLQLFVAWTVGDFSYSVPVVSGTTVSLQALAVGPQGALWTPFIGGLAPGASGITIDCPAPPTLTAPTNNQTISSANTPFSWSGAPNTVYQLNISNVSVWTESPTVTLPDLSDSGVEALVPGQQSMWNVYAISSLSSVDDVSSFLFGHGDGGLQCGATTTTWAVTLATDS
jgi:hypothetical protein